MQTDFLIAIRSYVSITTERSWPAYTSSHFERNLRTIDLFMRCQSRAYFERVAPMLGVSSLEVFKTNLSTITGDAARKMSLFGREDVFGLVKIDQMCTSA
jgi:hypothetical protein